MQTCSLCSNTPDKLLAVFNSDSDSRVDLSREKMLTPDPKYDLSFPEEVEESQVPTSDPHFNLPLKEVCDNPLQTKVVEIPATGSPSSLSLKENLTTTDSLSENEETLTDGHDWDITRQKDETRPSIILRNSLKEEEILASDFLSEAEQALVYNWDISPPRASGIEIPNSEPAGLLVWECSPARLLEDSWNWLAISCTAYLCVNGQIE